MPVIIDYATLDVLADAGGDKSPTFRATETAYGNGKYTQVVYSGRKRSYDTLSFTYSRELEHTQPVYDALYLWALNNVPFYYRFAAQEPARLYKVKLDSLKHRHDRGLRWIVEASFVEWDGLSSGI